MRRWIHLAVLAVAVLVVGGIFALPRNAGYTAYHHMGEKDAPEFLKAYPDKAGTKLDNCNLCHSGGSYQQGGKTVTVGSCQWCHYIYGYDASGDITKTLNSYGADYKAAGRNAAAIQSIDPRDSDGDGYSNRDEILAIRYPGDKGDDPSKVPAPFRVYTREQLERMPQHTQFLLMNTHKSNDFYAAYSGVPLETLFSKLMLKSATGIKVFSPDGWAQFHPLYPDANPVFYHVVGTYPPASFYYNEQADVAKNAQGWCDYSAPSVQGRQHGQPIHNPQGLKTLLAFKRDGTYLEPGKLTPQNKLDGEGPFRVVPPQKLPGPPDQKSTAPTTPPGGGTWVWPFDNNADHNAGFSTRTATIIKVEPLPAGTTDIDTMEAGWQYVDDAKIVVYGAIDPVLNVNDKLDTMMKSVWNTDQKAFKSKSSKFVLMEKIGIVKLLVARGKYSKALEKLQEDVIQKMDGCAKNGKPDGNDWITICEAQKPLYWAGYEISVLLRIVA